MKYNHLEKSSKTGLKKLSQLNFRFIYLAFVLHILVDTIFSVHFYHIKHRELGGNGNFSILGLVYCLDKEEKGTLGK